MGVGTRSKLREGLQRTLFGVFGEARVGFGYGESKVDGGFMGRWAWRRATTVEAMGTAGDGENLAVSFETCW